MTDSSHSPTTVSISKRTACDRCRGHKLRCPQREFTTQPCGRCTRLGVYCVTTLQCPIGRPGKNATSQHLQRLSMPEVTSSSVELDTAQIPIQPVGDYDTHLSIPIRGLCLSVDTYDSSSMTTFSPSGNQYSGSEELHVDNMNCSITGESMTSLEVWPVPDNDSNVLSESASSDTFGMYNHLQTQTSCMLQCRELSSHLNLSFSARLEHPPGSIFPTSDPVSLRSDADALALELSEQWGSQCVGDSLHDTTSLIQLMESDGRGAVPSEGEQILSS
ncbi:hypothetical protein GGR55DRAFT_589813 [Xylaria sp. FL0064]|nr:hypothetical protein GGR55DRAFT_589813 [Xylaria sp. FL0064]